MACSRFASFDDGLQVERYIYLKLSLTDTVQSTMEYVVERMVYLMVLPLERAIIFSPRSECSVKPVFTR